GDQNVVKMDPVITDGNNESLDQRTSRSYKPLVEDHRNRILDPETMTGHNESW
ncbi:hypothetical protein HAX54_042153, partial [Datura stramonium]|nr:hypothetical protein [Datura stramonium]